jgi:hypothetical protein
MKYYILRVDRTVGSSTSTTSWKEPSQDEWHMSRLKAFSTLGIFPPCPCLCARDVLPSAYIGRTKMIRYTPQTTLVVPGAATHDVRTLWLEGPAINGVDVYHSRYSAFTATVRLCVVSWKSQSGLAQVKFPNQAQQKPSVL